MISLSNILPVIYIGLNIAAVYSVISSKNAEYILNEVIDPRGYQVWQMLVIYVLIPSIVIMALTYKLLMWVPFKTKKKGE